MVGIRRAAEDFGGLTVPDILIGGGNMDFSAIGTSLNVALGTQLPRILGAVAILIIGWIVAVTARAGSDGCSGAWPAREMGCSTSNQASLPAPSG